MKEEIKFANDLIDFIHASPSQYHVVRNIQAALIRKGYKELNRSLKWNIEKGGKYFIIKNSSSIVAFNVGTGKVEEKGFKIIAAHTDSPWLKIKPEPEEISENSYMKLNVEMYGGAILNTWLDRPLSISGRVTLQSNDILNPEIKYINIKKPLIVIPNLAIHLNHSINKGSEISIQKNMAAVISLVKDKFEKKNYLKKIIAQNLNVEVDNILDFDLNLYEYEKGTIVGENEEFISCGKIDNLAMVHAGIESLINSETSDTTNVMTCFDNEEIGSRTKQGAASPFLKDVLQRVTWAFSKEKDAFLRAKVNSFGISADMAHAVHPNIPEKHDTIARPHINAGPVIKTSAKQKFSTDAVSSAVFEMICKKAKVPYQKYVNHGDEPGGGTLGNILSSQLDIRMADVGNPMLAMHSIRELGGVKDHLFMKKAFDEFYK